MTTDRRLAAGGVAICAAAIAVSALGVSAQTQTPAAPVDYIRDVRPVLESHCYECHGTKKTRGRLRLDVKVAALKGGMTGPAVIPGNADDSLVVRRILGLDGEDRMPLDKDALPADQHCDAAHVDSRRARPGRTTPPGRRRPSPSRPRTRRSTGRTATRPPDAARGVARPRGCEKPRSTSSSSRASKRTAWRRRPRPRRKRSSAASRWTSSACRRRSPRSTRSSPTRAPTPTSGWSIGCWRRPATESAGPVPGSTSHATPTATATRRTTCGRCGSTATG